MQGAGIIAKRVSAVSRARVVMKGGVVITFPPSSTFQNAQGNVAAPCSGASCDPIFPFSPLMEIHQSLDSMTAEVSPNPNHSMYFCALLKRAEKLLQSQNVLLGWCLWSWISCPPLLAGGCRASRPISGAKTLLIFGGCGVWKGLGDVQSQESGGIFRSFKPCPL